MNIHRSIPIVATALVLAVGGGATAAHEGSHRDASAPVRKEQKPWGIAGDPQGAGRTVDIAMGDDMRFTPSTVAVRQGETVRFVVTNKGRLLHEMVIGDRKTLAEHAALMARFPTMEHDEPDMAHVAPGTRETLVWTFNRAGDFEFACLVDGHDQAGMVGRIKVAADKVEPSQTGDSEAATGAGTATGALRAAPAVDSAELTEGEVRKVDKGAGKITLKHGAIRNLDMPPMTMVFRVVDEAVLDQVKAGDKVRFQATNAGGQLTITEIHAAQ